MLLYLREGFLGIHCQPNPFVTADRKWADNKHISIVERVSKICGITRMCGEYQVITIILFFRVG